jgi:hypothetical protein
MEIGLVSYLQFSRLKCRAQVVRSIAMRRLEVKRFGEGSFGGHGVGEIR